MALPPQKLREIVLQMLYSIEMGNPDEKEIVALFMKELNVSKKNVTQAWERAQLVFRNFSELDTLITNVSNEYRFERIQRVERNILRLGVYEMIYDETVPPRVAISEAVRLAKKFGTPEAGNFVNAIIDAILKSCIGDEVNEEEIKKTFDLLNQQEQAHDKH